MLRSEVMTFAQEIELKLQATSAYGEPDWKELTNTCLFSALKSEVRDLKEALMNGNPKEIIRGATSIGISVMQIADKARERESRNAI